MKDNAPSFFSIDRPIPFEGPETRNPLAFRAYDPDRIVLGRRMADHLRLNRGPSDWILTGF